MRKAPDPGPDHERIRQEPHPRTDRERVDLLLDEVGRLRMGLGALFFLVHDRLAEDGQLDRWLTQSIEFVERRLSGGEA